MRYAVYIIGDQISKLQKTDYHLSENYLGNVNRVFMGEQKVIENIDIDPEVFIIFEMINVSEQSGVSSNELIGWSILRVFDDGDNFM